MTDKLYLKTVKCPVCGEEAEIPYPKKGTFKIEKTDSDMMRHYEGIDISFYSIEYCNKCGYAALPSYFNEITEQQKMQIVKNISVKWNNRIIPKEYTVDEAIEQHKLALLNTIIKGGTSGEKALLCLRLSWLYRTKGDKENEERFQQKAITSFECAYQVETLPIGGLDKWHLLFLIGELYHRLGDNDKANIYFGQVLSSTQVPFKLKEEVRDMREMIKERQEHQNND